MFILASGSPFRAELLKAAGIPFHVEIPGTDEIPPSGASPSEIARIFARQKAEDVAQRFPEAYVLGCDQTLEIDGCLIRKPGNREEAREELMRLSGKTHFLHSAICLKRAASALVSEAGSTVRLTMYPLSPDDVERYLDTGEWRGCAGSFRIEAQGLQLFSAIQGDYHAIIGLPMIQLIRMLREAGLSPSFQPAAL